MLVMVGLSLVLAPVAMTTTSVPTQEIVVERTAATPRSIERAQAALQREIRRVKPDGCEYVSLGVRYLDNGEELRLKCDDGAWEPFEASERMTKRASRMREALVGTIQPDWPGFALTLFPGGGSGLQMSSNAVDWETASDDEPAPLVKVDG